LNEVLKEAPGLVKAEVASDRQSGRSRGFGTAQFNTVEEAEAAIKKFDNFDLEGRPMRVRFDRRGGRK
jgi:cold-inducible RNA-binding protein